MEASISAATSVVQDAFRDKRIPVKTIFMEDGIHTVVNIFQSLAPKVFATFINVASVSLIPK